MKRVKRLFSLVLSVCAIAAHAGTLVCQVGPNVTPETIASRYSITLADKTPNGPFALFTTPGEGESVAHDMRSDADIVWVQLDEGCSISDATINARAGTIPVVGDRNNIYQINTNLLGQIGWNESVAKRAPASKVAVIDTGVSQLATNLWDHIIFSIDQTGLYGNAYDAPNPLFQINAPENAGVGHGTMVAGLISALAPNSQLIVEKVAGPDGRAQAWSIVKGLVDAVAHGAQVCNISLGSPTDILALEPTIDWCTAQGLIIVAPAGNDNYSRAYEPAKLDGVICVAGLDNQNAKATFSNYDNRVHFSAPAVGVAGIDYDGQMAYWSGTSFSAPQVAAVFAMGKALSPQMSTRNLKDGLKRVGLNLDTINPAYVGKLGKGLQVSAFLTTLRSGYSGGSTFGRIK